MRDYRKTTRTREVRAAKKEGRSEMKRTVIQVFKRLGDRGMSGFTAAEVVASIPD